MNCTQDKKYGASSYPQDKLSGARLFSGKLNWFSNVIRYKKLVLNCSCFQEKVTGAQLVMFLGERDWC